MTYNFDFPLEPDLIDFEDKPNIFTDTRIKEPRQHIPRMSRLYVEDCLKLKIGYFGRHLLSRANPDKPEPERMFFVPYGQSSKAQVFYSLREEHLTAYIDIRCEFKGSWLTQYVELVCSNAGYGLRPYFTCACGYRCANLYLHPEKWYSFVCRHCLGLNYELNGVNRRSKHGKVTYWGIMLKKLINQEESIRHRAYRNNITRRFQAFALRHSKWQDFMAANKELIST